MPFANPLLEIDLAALCENYRRLAASCPRAEAAAVVKCDAYGLGAPAVARALVEQEGCASFFVAYSEEGADLRKAIGTGPEIFVFNGPFAEFLPLYREHALSPVLNTFVQARLWAAEMNGAPTALHIDTGMNRLGLPVSGLSELKAISGLNIGVVMSHLAFASDPSHPMNARQLKMFAEAAAEFPAARKSLSSSGGALIGSDFGFDLLRLGVGLYGVNPHDTGTSSVKTAARLTAPVLQVREIAAGETVGYGASFTATRRTIIATVSLGYGDGYPRAGSNRGMAFLAGAPCPIAGRVSMDLIVLDATDALRRPEVGERAEFFGPRLPIDAAAAACGTIGYELLTAIGGLARDSRGLGGRVRRRYLLDGAPVADVAEGIE